MNLHLCKFNVCGFNDVQVIHNVNGYVHGITPNFNFMFLLKHKLKGNKVKKLGDLLWKNANIWTIDVTLS
jgi:hypothetical protein